MKAPGTYSHASDDKVIFKFFLTTQYNLVVQVFVHFHFLIATIRNFGRTKSIPNDPFIFVYSSYLKLPIFFPVFYLTISNDSLTLQSSVTEQSFIWLGL